MYRDHSSHNVPCHFPTMHGPYHTSLPLLVRFFSARPTFLHMPLAKWSLLFQVHPDIIVPDFCFPIPTRIKSILPWVPCCLSRMILFFICLVSVVPLGPFRLGWCRLHLCFSTHQLEDWTTSSLQPHNPPWPLWSYSEALGQTLVFMGGASWDGQDAWPIPGITSASFGHHHLSWKVRNE